MRTIDFDRHNAEVKEVWDAYNNQRPIRVPIIWGINTRYTMLGHEANLRRMTFREYSENPESMLIRQLEHQDWVRGNVPQDTEMGPPADGWAIHVDFQNYYEAGWFGCQVFYRDDQVPDTIPLLQDDRKKNMVFDKGIPDPFEDGLMVRNWEYYDYFKAKKDMGFTWKGKPIAQVNPAGLGTDGPLTVACNLRGATEFFTDLLSEADYALKLLDYITEATIARIKAYRKRLGLPFKTQSWGFADDSVQLISTETYKGCVFPFHKRLVDEFSEGGPNAIHLCGDSTRHFLFLRDNLNIRSFDTGYPVDFGWLRRELGPDVEVKGGPSVTLLSRSSPDGVREEVKRILSSGIMEGGRFILREGNNLPPGVPLDNLWAMYKAGVEHGRYG